ncbi:phage tail protein [Burkholderia latens]|nr:phage tail protein [Burkholderia latens]
MSVTSASATATLTADEIVVGTALGGQKYVLGAFSKTINLATTGAGGMDTGSAPTSGYVALYAIYNPTTGVSALLATNATAAAQPTVYGGANMPSGYTASALVSVWPTNGSGQFVHGQQADRQIVFDPVTVLSANSGPTSLTSLSVSSAVPKNAKSINGNIGYASTTAAQLALNLSPWSSSVTHQSQGYQASGSNGFNSSFNDLLIVTAQTIYYSIQVNAGTPTFNVSVSGYKF